MKFIVISREELHQAVQLYCEQYVFKEKVRVNCVSAFWDDIAFNTMQRLPESYAVTFMEENK